jgi:hypothetical protein
MEETMRTSVVVGLLLGVLCGAAQADVENLAQFLRDCEAATHVNAPLRGDGQLEVTTLGGAPPSSTTRSAAVVIVRPLADVYMELREPGFKAVLLSQGKAYRVAAGAANAEAFAADALLGESNFTREDLQPFQVARYKGWRISDENANEVTVMLFPTSPPYSLVVITFDREKRVPLKTLYYRDTVNNLVKMRRDNNYVLVGGTWMAATVSMETFTLRTHSTLTLQWTQHPTFPPQLFDPAFLPHLSVTHASVMPAAATPGPK